MKALRTIVGRPSVCVRPSVCARSFSRVSRYSTPDFSKPAIYANTRKPIDYATTIVPEAFTTEEFHRAERTKIIGRSWFCVGHSSEVKGYGGVLVVDVDGTSIILTRNKKGELRGFHNVCRHRGAKMLEDTCTKVKNGIIRCPYHSWAYSSEGKCLATPLFQNGEGLDMTAEQRAWFESQSKKFNKADYGLFQVGVREWGALIFINLSGDNQEQWDKQLGDLPERFANFPFDDMKVVHQSPYHINANWKLIAENFMEYYHLPWVHPELCLTSVVDNHVRYQGRGHYMGFATIPLGEGTILDGPNFPRHATLTEVEREGAYFVHLFPNVSLFIFPHHIASLIAIPDGPLRTKEKMSIVMTDQNQDLPAEELAEKMERLVKFYDNVNKEDIFAVELVSQGLQNEQYPGGRFSFRFEETIHRFHNLIVDYMTDNIRDIPGDEVPLYEQPYQSQFEQPTINPPRRRGRPRKPVDPNVAKTPKPRGRPRKFPLPAVDESPFVVVPVAESSAEVAQADSTEVQQAA